LKRGQIGDAFWVFMLSVFTVLHCFQAVLRCTVTK
jgi:hypothetical protein